MKTPGPLKQAYVPLREYKSEMLELRIKEAQKIARQTVIMEELFEHYLPVLKGLSDK